MKSNDKLKQRKYLHAILNSAVLIGVSVICWYQLELSSNYSTVIECFKMEPMYLMLNVGTNIIAICLLYILFNRVWLSSLVLAMISFGVAIANYYIIIFKGMPLSIMEFGNFRTALNVIKGYKFSFDCWILGIILLFLVNCIICLLYRKRESIRIFNLKRRVVKDITIGCMCLVVLYIGYFSPLAIKPKETIGWSWVEAYHKYGYIACSIEMVYRTRNIIDEPEGYSLEKVENIGIPNRLSVNEYSTPDIIIIMNESFYDLSLIADVHTDNSYMKNINTLRETDNVISGYAIVPGIGGGTNSSEYELLTSNSLQLMKGITPFNVLDMKNANSVVSLLNQLGYSTWGGHSEPALNYSRGRAYPDMGFDKVFFDEEFVDKDYYENRWYETDASLYNNVITWYENMPENAPRFIYLLTIQNHGGWDLNPPEVDTVHVADDFAEYTAEINEYLSSIRLSDIAFKEFTEYFKKLDRSILICMVGDHCPSFASNIVNDRYSESQKQLRLRSVPFVIWSNKSIASNKKETLISMNYLVPLLIEVGNIDRSPYYQYLLDLMSDVPIITDYDIYIDRKGEEHSYFSIGEHSEEVKNYFYLEYNNLSKNRIQKYFDISMGERMNSDEKDKQKY